VDLQKFAHFPFKVLWVEQQPQLSYLFQTV
jgi:hypothetical protein